MAREINQLSLATRAQVRRHEGLTSVPGRLRPMSMDMGLSLPGTLVNPSCLRTWARVARDSWLISRAIGAVHESSGTAGRQRGPSDPSASYPRHLVDHEYVGPEPDRPGELVDTAGPQTRARVPQETRSPGQDIGPGPESPGAAGRHRRSMGMGLSRPGTLVNTSCHRTWARVARESWSTTWAVRHVPETPRGAGRPSGPSDPSACCPGLLVNPAGTRTPA